MDAIVLQGLSKTYMNGKRAVNRISFSLKQGEVFGFLVLPAKRGRKNNDCKASYRDAGSF